MARNDQRKEMKNHRKSLIKDLKEVYKKYFNLLTTLEISERDIAKLTQIMLHSQNEAITALSQKIEDPLITHPPQEL